MLDQALDCVASDINAHLQGVQGAGTGPVVLSSLAESTGGLPVEAENRVVLMLAALDEERNILEPTPPRGGSTAPVMTGQIHLNVHVMFAATHKHYASGLRALSSVIAYLKAKPVFDARNTPAMPSGLRQLSFNMEKLSYADLSNLWSYLGTSYLPAVNYTIRLVALGQRQLRANPPAIETVVVNS